MSKFTLLLVDDDPENLAILRRLFRNEHTLLCAEGGQEALELLEEHQVDLLITDYRMPGLNGAELLEQVRQQNPHVVRIVLTAYSDPQEVIDVINRGEAYRYITKPFKPEQLRIEVQQALKAYALRRERDAILAELQRQNEQLLLKEAELRRLNESLEGRVQQRTEELAKANAQLEEALKEVTTLARTDALTHLWNRRYVFEMAERELQVADRYGQPLSILMVDLDHFKRINDEYGHRNGDTVLRSVAEVLGKSVRNIDLCGRYGGEEFVIVLPQTDEEGATIVGKRMLRSAEALTVPTEDEKETLRVTLSIGIALYPDHGKNLGGVLEAADEALYQAKAAGRNRLAVARKTQQ